MKLHDTIYSYSIVIFILVLLLDPTNQIFKLKQILLMVLLLQFTLYYKKIKKSDVILFISYYLIPNLYAILIVLINSIPYDLGVIKTSLLGGFIGLFLIILSPLTKKEMLNIFSKSLKMYSVIYFIIVCIYLVFPIEVRIKLYELTLKYENIMIAPKVVFGYLPMIFYKTSPILVIYFSYLLYKSKYIFGIIVGFLLLISGTSANLLSMLLIICFYLISMNLKKISTKLLILIFGLIAIFAIVLGYKFIFLSGDSGNSIKYNDVKGYLLFWMQNPNKLIFGSGLGSEFYSLGRQRIVYTTEMTYFEILRVYGLFIGGIISFILLFPLLKLIETKSEKWLLIGYLAYIFIGGTNPLILSSTGSLVIIFTYSYLKCSKKVVAVRNDLV